MEGYRVGEELRVVDRIYGHGFKIGEIITIGGFGRDSFDGSLIIYAKGKGDEFGWSLGVDEVEKIAKIEEVEVKEDWILDPLKEDK
ncbi:YorP-like protein [Bacillus phage Kirov]|uniref:YorP-like protein n=1 Tax=Bacillus phage Kirov TaxID=2783539 RepID=A0A7U3RYA4_9CAUD|nr:YorP-like protein [Bacillus phage Kirov]QOV08288.1 YorP-like protein [Bacillus phage Kirov]